MFTKNIFNQKDGIADLVGNILEADYKNKVEELKGDQHKIDKNKNNKIDAHDFKILRGEKTMQKEASATPHYTDDSGNQYHYGASGYVSVKNKSGIDQGQRHLNEMSAVHKKNYEKVHGMAWNQKNEQVELDEGIFDAFKKGFKEGQTKTLAAKAKEHGLSDTEHKRAMDIHQKDGMIASLQYIKSKSRLTKEEQLDELSKSTLGSYIKKRSANLAKKAEKSTYTATDSDRVKKLGWEKDADDMKHDAQKIHSTAMKHRQNINKAVGKLTREEVEDFMQTEEYEKLDELSKSTLASYVSKRLNDVGQKSAEVGIHSALRDRYGVSDGHTAGYHGGKSRKAADVVTKHQQNIGKAVDRLTKEEDEGVAEEAEQVDERTLTKGETTEKERIVKGMKKSLAGFKSRYGDKAKSVMYATATARAKKD
jgi:hypothetical protein